MEETKTFPNGFTNWTETHYQIVEALTEKEYRHEDGQGGNWELAKRLTDKFESTYKDVDWPSHKTDYFETIAEFLEKELS